MSMDTLLCAEVYRQYSQLIELIEQLMIFPSAALGILRNAIKQIETITYKNSLATYDDLVSAVEQMLEFPESLDDLQDAQCELMIQCDVIVRSAVPADTGGYDIYDWFKRYVCANGFQTFMDATRQKVKAFIIDMIDSLSKNTGLDYMRDRILSLIDTYNDYLNQPIADYFAAFPTAFLIIFPWVNNDNVFDPDKANLFDLMKFLKNFAGCIFETCDFSVCVFNKIADVEDKLSYDPLTQKYIPKPVEIDMIQADIIMRSQMEEWLALPELQ